MASSSTSVANSRGLATLSALTSAPTGTLPGVAPEKLPPPVYYDLYSWSTKAPQTRLVYIRDHHSANSEIAKLQPGPLGFDLEWKPNYVKGMAENPVALVQLASADTILLIQVTAMREFPEKLRELLANPEIVKAGVGVQHDCKKLWADYAVITRNVVDLSLLARTVDNARWKGRYSSSLGLARLCETYEGLTLAKGKVQRSNWEAQLNAQQQHYAANDCHAGYSLYTGLYSMISAVSPPPQASYYTFDLLNGYLYHPTSSSSEAAALWQPHNPFYDPGPPPPPKPPKNEDLQGAIRSASAKNQSGAPSPSLGMSGPRRLHTFATRKSMHSDAHSARPNQSRPRLVEQRKPHENDTRFQPPAADNVPFSAARPRRPRLRGKQRGGAPVQEQASGSVQREFYAS